MSIAIPLDRFWTSHFSKLKEEFVDINHVIHMDSPLRRLQTYSTTLSQQPGLILMPVAQPWKWQALHSALLLTANPPQPWVWLQLSGHPICSCVQLTMRRRWKN